MSPSRPPEAAARLTTQEITEEKLAWLALALTPGLGPTRILRAVSEMAGTPDALFSLSLTALEGLKIPASSAQFIFDGKARRVAEAEWKRIEAEGVGILTYGCKEYPERLREIYDPPPVLWVRGDPALLSRPSIAVVGTRHPSPYGLQVAESLSRDLANRRLLIISGMARGIDTAAHKGALAAHAPTVAIWGTGVDVIYPKENKRLAEQIMATGGAIAAEVPMGTFPAPQNFPRRNRILSGLSVGVLVVEASENSGTRITARCALDQNRDVYAVPGNVTNQNSWTPNFLIKAGARLTATWEDIWEDLPSQIRLALEAELVAASELQPDASLPVQEKELKPQEALLLGLLRQDAALQLDEIMDLVGDRISSSEVFMALFELELAGKVRALPGKNYVRAM